MFIRIAVKDTETGKTYFCYPSAYQLKKYDNGALISCGWSVPDELPRRSFRRMEKQEVSTEEWQHSGCLSQCTRRGDKTCRW